MAFIFGLSMAKTAGRTLVGEFLSNTGNRSAGRSQPGCAFPEYVVMRFAELIDERKVPATIRRASKKWRGNGGAISLLHHGKTIIKGIGSLKPDRNVWS